MTSAAAMAPMRPHSQLQAASEAVEEPGGVEIASAGGVDDLGARRGVDHMQLVLGDDDRALGRAGQNRDIAKRAHRLQAVVEAVHLIKRHQLRLVGEQNVDMALRQRPEIVAIAVDAERVGEAEGDTVAGGMGDIHGGQEGFLGPRRIPQVAFQVGDFGRLNQRAVDVLRSERDRGAKIGRHGALGVRGDQDQAARRLRPGFRRRGSERNSQRLDVMRKDISQLIVFDLADEGGGGAQRRQPGDRVRHRAAGALDAGRHALIQRLRPRLIDQCHGPLG